MRRLASRFGFYALPLNFEGQAVEPSQTTVVRVTKQPTGNTAMFLETNEAAPYSFAYRVGANHEFYRQFVSPIFGRRHTSSRSFANPASLSVSVKPSTPQAPELG
jgi:hypothetical protein